jgi:hypothetical protein
MYAAAGATACMYGESTWNPESVGDGGNGIMGWTPARPGIVTGNPTRDMDKQLPMIISYCEENGDMGYVAQMRHATSVLQAANIWGPHIERFGISDIHSEGLSLASSFMGGRGAAGVASLNRPEVQAMYNGGMITEPIVGRGLATGTQYTFGEYGPEMVTPMGNGVNTGGGDTYNIFPPESATNASAYARTLIQAIRDYKRQHGNQPTNIG